MKPTWLSIHLKPTAAVHSFFAALFCQSKLKTLSMVAATAEKLALRCGAFEKTSP